MFDRVIIATGDSNRHVKSLAKNVHDKVREAGGQVIGIEGEDAGEWVLVDLGDIVVHVMQPAVRSYYNLEELWKVVPKRRARRPPATPTGRMKLIVAAVSQRPPEWVVAGWTEYAKRMPRELPLELLEIKPEPRTTGKTAEAMMALEAARIDAQLPAACRRIALDERGEAPTTRQLAERLAKWMAAATMSPSSSAAPTGWTPGSRNRPTKPCAFPA
jgi:ribosome silencing factor RsfS/YbeB/iojap